MAIDQTETTGTQLVYSPHPFLASADRRVIVEPFEAGESIATYIDRVGVQLGNQPVVLTLDGEVVPREAWAMTVPRHGSIINLRAIVQDGGGGSDPKRTILTIAVIAAAMFVPGAAFGLTAGTWQFAAVSAAVMMGGMAVVNSLVPVPQPELANLGQTDKASPTYALSGGSNRVRPHEPMPLLIGRHRVFPDLSSQPYTEYEDEDQYLYQIFNFGLTEMRLSELRIGDTLLSDFGDAEFIVSGDDGSVKDFPSNVDSMDVGAKLEPDVWVTRTSSVSAVRLSVDLVGSLFALGDSGLVTIRAAFQIEYRQVGDSVWLPAVNGYVPNSQYTHYWSAGTYRSDGDWAQFNYGSTDPNEHVDGDVYARIPAGEFWPETTITWRWRPFSELIGLSAWDPAPPQDQYSKQDSTFIDNGTRKPVRKTYKWNVPRGQYEIRVKHWQGGAVERNDNVVNDFTWTTLRTYQPDDTDYSGQKRVALKVRASANLSGVLQKFNAVAEGWIRDWTGTSWDFGPTSNPASWFLWFARGQIDANGDRLFGALVPDSRIDVVALQEWHTWCEAKGLTCNLVVDRNMSCADVLAAIARCGRATFTWANGKLSVIWDADGQPETAVFGMSNIVAGSFKVDYVTEKLADEIVVRFVNPDIGWQQDTVRVQVPGVSSPERPVTIDLWGCTDKTMAGKYANLYAAAQVYHRRRISWETDIEGQVAVRGDVVRLSHDLTQWGYSGRLVAGTTSQLTLDEAVPFSANQSHYVSLRQPDGTWSTHPIDYQAGENAVITISAGSELTVAPDAGRPVDWLWFFAPEPTPGKQVKIVDARPVSEDRWRFIAIDEEPAYYAAEGGAFTHVPVSIQLPAPEVSGLSVSETVLNYQDNTVQVHITWRLRGSEKARVRIGVDGGDLQDYGEHAGGYLDVVFVESSQLVIEVTAVVLAQLVSDPAAVATTQYTVGEYTLAIADPLPVPADVTGLELDGLDAEQGQGNATEFTGRDIKLVWRRSATQRAYELGQEPRGGDSGQLDGTYDGYRVRVYHGDQFDAASLVREAHVRSNRYDYLYEMNAEDGLSRQVSVEVVGLDIYGNESARPARITVTNPAPELPLGVSVDARFQHFRLRYTEPADLDFEGMRVWVGTVSGFTADDNTRVFDGPGELIVIDSLADGTALVTGGVYYVRFAPYDAFGRSGLNMSAEYQVTLQAIDPADTQGFSDWAFKLDPADKAWISARLQAGSIDSTRIESLVASKIAAGILQSTIEIQSGGMIRATNSGTDYEYRTGFESDGGSNYIIRYGNLTTSHWPFTMDVNGNIAMEGALTFKPGTTGIANVADAGALAGQDDVDWQLQVTGASKPQDNATVGATWGVNIDGNGLPDDYASASDSNLILDPNFAKKIGGVNYWADHPQALYCQTCGENSTPGCKITANGTIIDVQAGAYYPSQYLDTFHVRVRIFVSADFDGTVSFGTHTYDAGKNDLNAWPSTTIDTQKGFWRTHEATISVGNPLASYTKFRMSVRQDATAGFVVFSDIYVSRVQSGADVTALNTAADTAAVNGRAAAAVDSDAAAGATFTGADLGVQGGLLPNWACNLVDPDGYPAGIRAVESATDRVGLEFADANKTAIRISHPTDSTRAYGFPAIPIDDQQKYRVTIRHMSSNASSNGLYLRFNELSGALPSGKTHVGSGGESVTAARTSIKDLVGNAPFPSPADTWVEDTYTYTPTPGTQWASFTMYNWNATVETYDVDAVMITPIAKTADQIAESSGRKWAGESGADKTLTAIETGLAVTAGAITYGTNIVLDFLNKFIGIGTAWWTTTTANISLDHNNGQPRAYIGDGDEAYFLLDTQQGIAECGREMQFRGADSYHNKTIYDNYMMSGLYAQTAGNGSVIENGWLTDVDSGNQTGSYAQAIKHITVPIEPLSWYGVRRIKAKLKFTGSMTTWDGYFATGKYEVNYYAGFRFTDSNVYGVVKNSGSPEVALNLAISLPWNIEKLFEVVCDGPAGITYFYVDGTLRGQLNSVPSGGTPGYLWFVRASSGPSGADARISFSRVKFLQN